MLFEEVSINDVRKQISDARGVVYDPKRPCIDLDIIYRPITSRGGTI